MSRNTPGVSSATPPGGARSEENHRPRAAPGGARSKENSGAISECYRPGNRRRAAPISFPGQAASCCRIITLRQSADLRRLDQPLQFADRPRRQGHDVADESPCPVGVRRLRQRGHPTSSAVHLHLHKQPQRRPARGGQDHHAGIHQLRIPDRSRTVKSTAPDRITRSPRNHFAASSPDHLRGISTSLRVTSAPTPPDWRPQPPRATRAPPNAIP